MRQLKIPGNIEEYISGFPEPVQIKLREIRAAIRKAAPDAKEKISYRMPAFTLNGMLVYFAAHTNHIGFYPMSAAIDAFKKELSDYKRSKGTIQFPLDKPLPKGLITRIIKFRVAENMAKAELKKNITGK